MARRVWTLAANTIHRADFGQCGSPAGAGDYRHLPYGSMTAANTIVTDQDPAKVYPPKYVQ